MASETASAPVDAEAGIGIPGVWRLSFWGGAALIALAIATLSAVSETGAQRLQLALNSVIGPAALPTIVAQIPQKQPEPALETIKLAENKLAENLRLLAADRDRLNGRVASLERTLEDVTGSIKRQAERAAEQASRQPPQPAAPAPPIPPISPPATMTAVVPPAAPYVPLPPERLANIEASAPMGAPAPPPKPEIGIDLGGASSPEALRAHWVVIKANYGPLLRTLRPMLTMRERTLGTPIYRLILGPVANTNAAGHLCAQLVAARVSCRATTFISQSTSLL